MTIRRGESAVTEVGSVKRIRSYISNYLRRPLRTFEEVEAAIEAERRRTVRRGIEERGGDSRPLARKDLICLADLDASGRSHNDIGSSAAMSDADKAITHSADQHSD
jgi:hypothetical protein